MSRWLLAPIVAAPMPAAARAACTTVWGGTGVALPSGNRTISFYGRIFAGQDVTAGNYFDFITITLDF